MKRWRIAVVVQRYGEEVNGGAELHARWLAEHLQALGEVQVITTCALDYTTWENYYSPGSSVLQGVHVQRFPVDSPRNWKHEQKQTGKLINTEHTLFDELVWVKNQGPYSTPLLQYIQKAHEEFDFFIFFTYLYATTFFGLPLVADKAILVPTAHDDPFLSLPLFYSLFHLPRAIIYNTLPEKRLVNQVTNNGYKLQRIAGVGINVPQAPVSPSRFREKYGIEGEFILYVGRIHESKNVPELLDYFQRYRTSRKELLTMALVGKSHLPLPIDPEIKHLGFITEEEKFDAMRAASLVVIPSLYESLSMVMLEAWLMQTPVLVNGGCDVLKQLCRLSNGGLYYTSYDEFLTTMDTLLTNPLLREQLGRQGHQFVASNYSWKHIIHCYQEIFEQLSSQTVLELTGQDKPPPPRRETFSSP